MKICWVTNEKKYSRLYRWLFKEDASHAGSVFTFGDSAIAVDLNRPFGRIWDIRHWLSKYTIIWSMEVELTQKQESEMYEACRDYAVMRDYDMPGYYYGMIAGLRRRLLGIRLPKKNIWSRGTGSMCQEIVVPIVQHPVFRQVVGEEVIPSTGNDGRTLATIREMLHKATKDHPKVKWTYNG
jgi:hypothetical protein